MAILDERRKVLVVDDEKKTSDMLTRSSGITAIKPELHIRLKRPLMSSLNGNPTSRFWM